MLLIINLPLIGLWVRLLKVPYRLMFPAILMFCCIGIYSINSLPTDVMAIGIFGLIGYALIKFGLEPAPLLLGFVLGPMLEEHLRRAMIISRGDPTVFVTRPLSGVLLVLAVAILVIVFMPAIARKREEVFQEE
jgi:putative tricarboxylic transport membrane protein